MNWEGIIHDWSAFWHQCPCIQQDERRDPPTLPQGPETWRSGDMEGPDTICPCISYQVRCLKEKTVMTVLWRWSPLNWPRKWLRNYLSMRTVYLLWFDRVHFVGDILAQRISRLWRRTGALESKWKLLTLRQHDNSYSENYQSPGRELIPGLRLGE